MNHSTTEADDVEMIAVSPICSKFTPVNRHNNSINNDSLNFVLSPNLFGSPPTIARRPVLHHQHSYAGQDDNTTKIGPIPARTPNGRPYSATRQLSMPDLRQDSFQGTSSPSYSSFLNNISSDEWTNHLSLRNLPQTEHERHEAAAMAVASSLGEGDDAPREAPAVGESLMTDNQQNTESPKETNEERARREEEESIALAQMLMAEEAMASHRMSADFLRMNSDQFSDEDFLALQGALREEEEAEYEEEGDDDAEPSEEMSYEALLRLGERIGDVKTDRWTMIAHKEIAKLDSFRYDSEKLGNMTDTAGGVASDIDDSELKCLVCQFAYEKGDVLRRLPCGHCFHKDCIDQWLQTKDICAYCRQSIRPCADHK
jgi:Ring finger domain